MIKESRPVIAVITGVGFAVVEEFRKQLGERAEIIPVYLKAHKFSYYSLEESLDKIYHVTEQLDQHRLDALVYASMSGSCLRGHQIKNFFEQRYGIPVFVSAIETLHMLKKANVKKITVVSPFCASLTLIEKYFFEKNGIEIIDVINFRGSLNEEAEVVTMLDEESFLPQIAKKLTQAGEAIVFDSPTYYRGDAVIKLQDIMKIPVLTSNQALLDSICQSLGLGISGEEAEWSERVLQ